MSDPLPANFIKNNAISEIEIVSNGKTTSVSAPVTIDNSMYNYSNITASDAKERIELLGNAQILEECSAHFRTLASDCYKSIDIENQASIHELVPLIESLIVASEYAFKGTNKKLFKAQTALNKTGLDYRMKCVVEATCEYLKSHNDHSIDLTNSDIHQMLIALCQMKYELVAPSLSRLVKTVYKYTAKTFCK